MSRLKEGLRPSLKLEKHFLAGLEEKSHYEFRSCEKMNFAKNHMSLEENSDSDETAGLANTLAAVSEEPKQRKHLSCIQIPGTQKF